MPSTYSVISAYPLLSNSGSPSSEPAMPNASPSPETEPSRETLPLSRITERVAVPSSIFISLPSTASTVSKIMSAFTLTLIAFSSAFNSVTIAAKSRFKIVLITSATVARVSTDAYTAAGSSNKAISLCTEETRSLMLQYAFASQSLPFSLVRFIYTSPKSPLSRFTV